MKTKTDIKILKLPLAPALRCIKLASLGFALASGRFAGIRLPLGLALISSVVGVDGAASASIGIVIGSFFMPSGLWHAAIALLVFTVRLALGGLVEDEISPLEEKKSRTHKKGVCGYIVNRLTDASKKAFAESVPLRMTVASLSAAAYGALLCIEHNYTPGYFFSTAVSAVTAPILAYFYSAAFLSEGDRNKLPIRGGAGVLRRNVKPIREAGRLIFAVSLTLSLKYFPFGFDLSVPSAFLVTLHVTRCRGILYGTLYGLACGGVLTPVGVPMYVISAFIFGTLGKTSAAIGVSAACSAACVWSVYSSGLSAMNYTVPSLILTSAAAAPVFSLGTVPKYTEKSSTSAVKDSFKETMLRRETVKKMHTLSDCMKDLSGVLRRLSDRLTTPENEILCELCEDSFEAICKECGMQNACYGREADRTAALQAKMTLSLKRDGRVSAADVPQAMAKRCYSMDRIIDRMNAGYARLISEAKLYDRTSVVAEDYGVVSDMLRECSDTDASEYAVDRELTHKLRQGLAGRLSAENLLVYGGRMKKAVTFGVDMASGTPGGDDLKRLYERACGLKLSPPEFEIEGSSVNMIMKSLPVFSVRSGRASLAASELSADVFGDDADTKVFSPPTRMGVGKSASEACGDVISSFLTDDGRFFMLISDGMGSGSEASLTSGVCAVFLEKLLCAGASMDTSLKMLNSMMRVRGREVSATVDLMELDLMNGRTRFVKSGAAPSFVLRGGRLFRLQSKTVPIGIVRALDAELIKFECEKGDIIVMLSDGVARSFEDCPWLYDLLCDEGVWRCDPDTMARKIIKNAIINGASDDITAGVAVVE